MAGYAFWGAAGHFVASERGYMYKIIRERQEYVRIASYLLSFCVGMESYFTSLKNVDRIVLLSYPIIVTIFCQKMVIL